MDLLKKGIPLLPAVTLEKDRIHMLKAPYFETSACLGINVISTPKTIIVKTMSSIKRNLEDAAIRQNRNFKSEISSR